MARYRHCGRRPAAAALAGAAVLALTACAAAEPEAAPLGRPGVASAAGAMGSAEPANPVSSGSSGNPASRDHAARASGSSHPADPDQAVSSTDSANPGDRANPASPATCPDGSGFALAMVSDYYGWATPEEAAQQFSRQANPSGYGTPNTVWTASAPDSSGVTLTATDLMLHAVRLANGRWAIDSGQRCD